MVITLPKGKTIVKTLWTLTQLAFMVAVVLAAYFQHNANVRQYAYNLNQDEYDEGMKAFIFKLHPEIQTHKGHNHEDAPKGNKSPQAI